MNRLQHSLLSLGEAALIGLLTTSTPETADAADLYKNDFQQAEAGKIPEDLMVLEGAFAIKEENGNKFLELPGTPLETFGVLFGPNESAGLAVTARIHGTATGRRAPAFGVGLNGVGGFKLQMAPGKRVIELYRGDQLLASAPAKWHTGSWTILRLAVSKSGPNEWKIEGKAWKEGDKEPAAALLSHIEKTEPTAGKASLWGAPYSGTPIRFDDIRVLRVESSS
jgi:hypothetical protein